MCSSSILKSKNEDRQWYAVIVHPKRWSGKDGTERISGFYGTQEEADRKARSIRAATDVKLVDHDTYSAAMSTFLKTGQFNV